MAQMLDPMAARRIRVQELYDEMDGDTNPSNKYLLDYLKRKDGLIGGGKHHAKRVVSRGQIMGDLRDWLEDPHHQ